VTPNLTTPIADRNFTITQTQFLVNELELSRINTIGSKLNSDVSVTWSVKAVWADKVNNVPNTTGVPYPEDVILPFKWEFKLPILP
jgi:hypothetical protein